MKKNHGGDNLQKGKREKRIIIKNCLLVINPCDLQYIVTLKNMQ